MNDFLTVINKSRMQLNPISERIEIKGGTVNDDNLLSLDIQSFQEALNVSIKPGVNDGTNSFDWEFCANL